jgi:tetratricopeptide (TPR) repeat protein
LYRRREAVEDSFPLSEIFDRLEAAERDGDTARTIDLCRRGLAALDRELAPEVWALLHGLLADKLAASDETEAIEHYRLALEVFEQTSPAQAATQHGQLGNIYARRGDVELAIHHYERALAGFDRNASPLDWAMTHYHLGECFATRGDSPARVVQHFERALEVIEPETRPGDWRTAHVALGDAYAQAGDATQARRHYLEALSTIPAERRQARGLVLEKLAGVAVDDEEAIGRFEEALASYRGVDEDGTVRAHGNLGYLYRRTGNLRSAIDHLEAALALRDRARHAEEWATLNAALGLLYADPRLDDG